MPKKSKKVTFNEVCEAYTSVMRTMRYKRQADLDFVEYKEAFDTLCNRTSKEVLAKFVRESNLFDE